MKELDQHGSKYLVWRAGSLPVQTLVPAAGQLLVHFSGPAGGVVGAALAVEDQSGGP